MTENPRTWLVDSNVLIDILQPDPRWCSWSSDALAIADQEGGAAINPVIYAEIAAGFVTIESLEADLARLRVSMMEFPRASLFLAGRQFGAYRMRSEGPRTSLLPDFLIGAQAAILGLPILTRDTRRYRTYFPTVRLITPATLR